MWRFLLITLVMCLRANVSTKDIKEEQPWLLVADENTIRRIEIDSGEQQPLVQGLSLAVSVDYDYKKKTVFWSDVLDDRLYRVTLLENDTKSTPLELKSGMVTRVWDIAVDWVYGNIYWIDAYQDRVDVARQDGTFQKTILDTDLDSPFAIAVDPREGLLFLSDNGQAAKLERISMDGDLLTRMVLVDEDISWTSGISIDFTERKIYWIDNDLEQISTINYDGTDRRLVLRVPKIVTYARGMDILGDNIYWCDSNSIRAVNKYNESDYKDVIEGLTYPEGLKVFHHSRQVIAENHCGDSNGGCSYLCVPRFNLNNNGQNYSCLCPNSHYLSTDNYSCVPKEFSKKLIVTTETGNLEKKNMRLQTEQNIHIIQSATYQIISKDYSDSDTQNNRPNRTSDHPSRLIHTTSKKAGSTYQSHSNLEIKTPISDQDYIVNSSFKTAITLSQAYYDKHTKNRRRTPSQSIH